MTRRSNFATIALLALLCAAAVVLGWCASEAGAQGQQTSCWGSGILGGRCFPLDTSVRPWGPSGGHVDEAVAGAVRGGELFNQRYAVGNLTAGSQPIGPVLGETGEAVFTLQHELGREPTAEEVWDLIVQVPRCAARYFDGSWKPRVGGTESNPDVVDGPEDWVSFYELLRVCETGTRALPWHVCGWAKYTRFDWLPASRPWCDVPLPTVGLRVEVEAFPEWLAGVVTRVSGTSVTIRLDAGGSRTEGFADEGRRWRRAGGQPVPTPSPTSTPPPPVVTPTPEPTPPACPTVECPTCPTCPPPVPKCAPLSARSRANLTLMLDGTMVRPSARLRLRRELATRVNCTVPGGGL